MLQILARLKKERYGGALRMMMVSVKMSVVEYGEINSALHTLLPGHDIYSRPGNFALPRSDPKVSRIRTGAYYITQL
jgi:hypothetical protein